MVNKLSASIYFRMYRRQYGLHALSCSLIKSIQQGSLSDRSRLYCTKRDIHSGKRLLIKKSHLVSLCSRNYTNDSGANRSYFYGTTCISGAKIGLGLLASILFYKSWTWVDNEGISIVKSFPLTARCASPGPGGDGSILGLRDKYNFIADVVEKVSPAVVYIKSSSYFRQGAGSGFIISEDGLVVTNEHVVRSAKNGQVQVELIDGRTYTGFVEVVDPASDLALVKINEKNLPSMSLGSSASLRPGEWVIAMGSPLTLSNTVTSGIVSSTARKSKELGIRNEIDYIQTDAPITFGNSGGPLINLDGEAVGVNSMKVAEGISFAIPSDYVKKFLLKAGELKKKAEAKRRSQPAYIGVSGLTLTPHIAAQLRNRPDIGDLDADHGVFVVRVTPDSPAYRAGVKKYDVIVKINGEPVTSVEDLHRCICSNSEIKCTIQREGTNVEVVVKPQAVQ